MASDEQQINEQMRRAAAFVLRHQRALLQALIGQADTLDGHAAELREIARKGGNEALSARAAAEAATRRHAEATDMRAARAALVVITGPAAPPTPDEQGESAQKTSPEGRPDEHPQ